MKRIMEEQKRLAFLGHFGMVHSHLIDTLSPNVATFTRKRLDNKELYNNLDP